MTPRKTASYKPPQTLDEISGFGWRIETQGMWPRDGGEPIIQLVGEVRTMGKVETIVRAVSLPRQGAWSEQDVVDFINDDRRSLQQTLIGRQRVHGARPLS